MLHILWDETSSIPSPIQAIVDDSLKHYSSLHDPSLLWARCTVDIKTKCLFMEPYSILTTVSWSCDLLKFVGTPISRSFLSSYHFVTSPWSRSIGRSPSRALTLLLPSKTNTTGPTALFCTIHSPTPALIYTLLPSSLVSPTKLTYPMDR